MALSFAATSNPSPVSPERRAEILAAPGFGQFMTDHMIRATWREGEGWGAGELTAYGNISISPAASVLHYAPEIFEGLKAYRHEDGSVWTFRPDKNAERLQASARRMVLP